MAAEDYAEPVHSAQTAVPRGPAVRSANPPAELMSVERMDVEDYAASAPTGRSAPMESVSTPPVCARPTAWERIVVSMDAADSVEPVRTLSSAPMMYACQSKVSVHPTAQERFAGMMDAERAAVNAEIQWCARHSSFASRTSALQTAQARIAVTMVAAGVVAVVPTGPPAMPQASAQVAASPTVMVKHVDQMAVVISVAAARLAHPAMQRVNAQAPTTSETRAIAPAIATVLHRPGASATSSVYSMEIAVMTSVRRAESVFNFPNPPKPGQKKRGSALKSNTF